jgi:hypothetical protein
MSIALERVESFLIRHRGQAYCEVCIQRGAGVARRKDVHDVVEGITLDMGQRFLRLLTACSQCGETRHLCASR